MSKIKKTKEVLKLLNITLLKSHKLYTHINLHNYNRLMYHLKNGNFRFIREKLSFFTDINAPRLKLDLIKEENYNTVLEFPIFKTPKVSIIIPVYNQWQYTYKCLKSILLHTSNIEYEIIIADDVSIDETVDINKVIKNISVERNKRNLGFLLNCNNAAKKARGEYILFLNNDTQVQLDWLSSLLALIESDKTIGMVGSKLVYPDGRLQEAGGIIWNDASGWNFGRLDDPTKSEYNYVKEVDYISGASIMIRKDLWNEIGAFDERYAPAYYEDSDLAFEVRKHGYKVMFQPKSVVVHFEGISHGINTGSGIKAYQVKNKEKFIEKWKDELNEQFKNANDVFLARDRSKSKKHILVIDHYVPHYDQDAGSRTMWQYLKLFKELDYQVTFIGDNFYKHEPYTSILEQKGIEVLYGKDIYHNYKQWIQNNCKYFDFIYLIRPKIAIKYLSLIHEYKENAKIFYNGTDFHFLRLEREYEINKISSVLVEAKKYKKLEFEIFNSVDVVLTISEYEKKFFEQNFPHKSIKLIPTFIYEETFPLSKNDDYDLRNGIIFVGGFAHTPNYVGIKWFLDNIWNQVKKEIPNIKLNIVGSHTPNDIVEYANLDSNINVWGFVPDEKLLELYNCMKVVIAPLTFGAGVKGKVIEAIASGLPVVTTTIGAEGIPNVTDILFIADNEKEFAQLIVEIHNDPKLWKKIRNKEIAYSNLNMSYSATKQIVGDIFR